MSDTAGGMQIPSVVAQLRTTDLAAPIRWPRQSQPAEPCTGIAWGTWEFVIRDDQERTLYFGEAI